MWFKRSFGLLICISILISAHFLRMPTSGTLTLSPHAFTEYGELLERGVLACAGDTGVLRAEAAAKEAKLGVLRCE